MPEWGKELRCCTRYKYQLEGCVIFTSQKCPVRWINFCSRQCIAEAQRTGRTPTYMQNIKSFSRCFKNRFYWVYGCFKPVFHKYFQVLFRNHDIVNKNVRFQAGKEVRMVCIYLTLLRFVRDVQWVFLTRRSKCIKQDKLDLFFKITPVLQVKNQAFSALIMYTFEAELHHIWCASSGFVLTIIYLHLRRHN